MFTLTSTCQLPEQSGQQTLHASLACGIVWSCAVGSRVVVECGLCLDMQSVNNFHHSILNKAFWVHARRWLQSCVVSCVCQGVNRFAGKLVCQVQTMQAIHPCSALYSYRDSIAAGLSQKALGASGFSVTRLHTYSTVSSRPQAALPEWWSVSPRLPFFCAMG
jgi:hypothetical protein